MSDYLSYWRSSTIRPDRLAHSASDQYERVKPGDTVWIVTIYNRKLSLVGPVEVDFVGSKREAARLLGDDDLWDARWHIVSRRQSVPMSAMIDISKLASQLRFESDKDRLPLRFTGQHLQTMRLLTAQSTALLRDVWEHRTEATPTTSLQRNPTWMRDELILALDLYIRLGRVLPDDTHPDVIALSELLNTLPIHAERPDAARFRNPNAVALKLANFRALDQPGHGMTRGGRGDEEVWEEFADDPARLAKIAALIREGANAPEMQPSAALAVLEDEEDDGTPEGRLLRRMHTVRERNPALRKRKKAAVLRQGGKLACEVCGFEFAAVYGEIGDGFIECHHTVPISTVQPGSKTKLADLALVCANCHRMLHRRKRKDMSVAELVGVVAGTAE